MTTRDSWCFNFSRGELERNVTSMISFYNGEVSRWKQSGERAENLNNFISTDSKKISWSNNLKNDLSKGKVHSFDVNAIRFTEYRPFSRQFLYFNKALNERQAQINKIFVTPTTQNRVISVTGTGEAKDFSVLMLGAIPEYKTHYNGQNFPLKLYDNDESGPETDLFSGLPVSDSTSTEAITDAGLKHFQDAYPSETITKEDLFYYVYGLLHSEDYRAKYADNLSKELPRIPRVKTAADFWAFSRAGRELGDLHVNYETVEPYPVTIKQGDLRLADIKNPEAFYRVTKWAFGKTGKEKDKTTVIYNANITMQDIPLGAYDYVVNGKPALEWVMERQVVKTDKASGIENDANRYAIETIGNPAYPLELFQRVITVSLRTMEIVRALPKLEVM